MADKVKRSCWWDVKIEEQKARITELEGIESEKPTLEKSLLNEAYAQGYYDCMSKYGVMSKLQRRRLKERMELYGAAATTKRREGTVIS